MTVVYASQHQSSQSSTKTSEMAFPNCGVFCQGGAITSVGRHSRARSPSRGEKAGTRDRFTRGRPNRVPHYRELVKLTRATLAYLDQTSTKLAAVADPRVEPWQAELHRYHPL
jgi:IS5 family transposase